jgi:hypothetical protein
MTTLPLTMPSLDAGEGLFVSGCANASVVPPVRGSREAVAFSCRP